MTIEDQIKAAAELDGWEWCEENHQSNISEKFFIEKKEWHNKDKTEWLDHYRLSKYLTSYDAIIPLIQKQNKATQWKAWECVADENSAYPDTFNATPAQLLEALLRSTGKWTS